MTCSGSVLYCARATRRAPIAPAGKVREGDRVGPARYPLTGLGPGASRARFDVIGRPRENVRAVCLGRLGRADSWRVVEMLVEIAVN